MPPAWVSCPLWPPFRKLPSSPPQTHFMRLAAGPKYQFLSRWLVPCIHWLTSGLLQLSRNSVGLMAFSLTDLVRMTPLFFGNGSTLQISNKGFFFGVPSNATRSFVIKGISIKEHPTLITVNNYQNFFFWGGEQKLKVLTDFTAALQKSIPHGKRGSSRLRASKNMQTMRKRCQRSLWGEDTKKKKQLGAASSNNCSGDK